MKLKRKKLLLITSIAFAIVIHAGVLFWLYDWKWYLFPNTSSTEHQLTIHPQPNNQKRALQLTQTLNKIVLQPNQNRQSLTESEMIFYEIEDLMMFQINNEIAMNSSNTFGLHSTIAEGNGNFQVLQEGFSHSSENKGSTESLELVNAKASLVETTPKLGVGIHMGTMNASVTANVSHSSNINGILSGHGGNFANGNDFTLDIEYAQKMDGKGYIFKLKLTPQEDADFPRIAQNFYFLIDRSSSIRPERYEASKWGMIEALTLLQSGDTFNILMFDDQIQRLSSQNLEWNDQNILQAYDFLARQQTISNHNTDIYNSLGDIFPELIDDKEVNTAILLSDGTTQTNIDKLQSAIGRWTRQNAGKISLYSVASGSGNNLALLNLLSAVNKGVLHYTARDEDLPRLMSNLMLALQNPICKDIEANIVKEESKNKNNVVLFPSQTRLQNFYQRMPYIIYGTLDNLEDFHVFFHGKYYDKFLEIKKQVSFQRAKQVTDSSLEKMWAIQQAYDYYDQYLRSGDDAHLKHAQRLLTFYKISTPF